MNHASIHSALSPFRSVGRMAGLCDTMSCADCDCPAIVALALSTRIEKPEELRKGRELPEDIRELILKTRADISEASSGRCEVCELTDHDKPVFLLRRLPDISDNKDL